jgi:DNA-directed RNA polymerase specialized sigma24 family protein
MAITANVLPKLDAFTPEEFGDWARPHLRAMTLLAARLSSETERDDVVQEALSRAWAKRSQFDARRGTPAAWLLAITADQARRARRRVRPLALFAAGAPVRSIDDRLDLELAVARLPERQRLAIDCFYYVGLSVAETAAVMRCAEGTVKSTLSDARARLARILEGGGDAGRR